MAGWQSYDAVASAYDRSWHPAFEPVARDLLDLVAPEPEDAVLDVGTGTGVVAAAAATATARRGLLVGIDPSLPMLHRARFHVPLAAVAACSPGLPFPARTFDVVVAGLVVSHFPRYDDALDDMVRVLRPGGRLGVTAWGATGDAVDDVDQRKLTEIWTSTAARFVDVDRGEDDVEAAIPGEAWFADPARLRAALVGTRLRSIEVHGRVYRRDLSVQGALAGYDTSFWGRYLRHTLDDSEWWRFRDEVAAAASDGLPDPMTRVDQLLIGVGTKGHATRP